MLPVSKRPHVPRRTHQLASAGLLTATWTYFDMTCISRTTWFLEMSQIAASSFAWQTDSTTTRTRHLGFAGVSSNFWDVEQKSFNACPPWKSWQTFPHLGLHLPCFTFALTYHCRIWLDNKTLTEDFRREFELSTLHGNKTASCSSYIVWRRVSLKSS